MFSTKQTPFFVQIHQIEGLFSRSTKIISRSQLYYFNKVTEEEKDTLTFTAKLMVEEYLILNNTKTIKPILVLICRGDHYFVLYDSGYPTSAFDIEGNLSGCVKPLFERKVFNMM